MLSLCDVINADIDTDGWQEQEETAAPERIMQKDNKIIAFISAPIIINKLKIIKFKSRKIFPFAARFTIIVCLNNY